MKVEYWSKKKKKSKENKFDEERKSFKQLLPSLD